MTHRLSTARGALAAGLIALLLSAAPTARAQRTPPATQAQASTPSARVDTPADTPIDPSAGRAPAQSPRGAPTDTAAAIPATPLGPSGATPPASSSAPGTPANAQTTGPGAPSAPTEDIRDIRGPKFILPAWLIPALILAVALLALGAYALWRWYRRRQRPRALLPFELALQRLDDIRHLMQPASAREFTIAISDIVRGYIEERFDVTATHRTTEEFLHDLLQTTQPALARHRGLLQEFLQQCDLVKFGGMSLSVRDIKALHHSARAFVLETAKPDDATPVQSRSPQAPRAAPAATAATVTNAAAGATATLSSNTAAHDRTTPNAAAPPGSNATPGAAVTSTPAPATSGAPAAAAPATRSTTPRRGEA
jgi:Domain of unknown function (DUF4381)